VVALQIRLAAAGVTLPELLALPVARAGGGPDDDGDGDRGDGDRGRLLAGALRLPAELAELAEAFRADVGHDGGAGTVQVLLRPGQRPRRLFLLGIGDENPDENPDGNVGEDSGGEPGEDEPGEGDWRAAGAALVRAADKEVGKTGATGVTLVLPDGAAPAAVGALVEGALLAAYRYSLATGDGGEHLRRLTLVTTADGVAGYAEAVRAARIVAEVTATARDWTNTPGADKPPAWLADAIRREAGRLGEAARPGDGGRPAAAGAKGGRGGRGGRGVRAAAGGARGGVSARAGEGAPAGLEVRVWEPDRLRAEGFGGILAVGGGSPRGPRLVELRYRPRSVGDGRSGRAAGDDRRGRGAGRHVVLVGKGITFDTGGIDIKTNAGLQLMRKDMGGAAAVAAATIGAARLGLGVRVTALLPLADNAISGDAFRPGDVIRHYGGLTSEVLNTDAEGRLVLADAIAYAVRRLDPDVVVDLATLTGAQHVALGKRTAALFSEDDGLAEALTAAGAAAGERMWRLPLADDYLELMRSDVADVANIELPRQAGALTAALFLREFTGPARRRWAHLDMSAPAWSSGADGVLAKGATGWGVRMLLRYLST
jgi:leucyl aminopeptidase